ncbi:hypothetical protein MTO96_041525 [Rhipicephalus appendiculatus]
MLPTPKAYRQVHRQVESSCGPKEGVTASTSDLISNSCDSSSPSTTCVDERRSLAKKGQSVLQNAASAGGSALGREWDTVEHSLSFPGCSGYSSEKSQGRYRLRLAFGGLRKQLFQAAAESLSGTHRSEREGDVDVAQRAPFCRTCSFRRQLREPNINKYHWWDPGPPRADSGEYSLADVFM